MRELISIVIPCFNDEEYIEKAVASALKQEAVYVEVIVIDDGSDQRTKKVLNSLISDGIKLITQENKGQAAARNRGIEAATSAYIVVLDSDDSFEKEFCIKALKQFQKSTITRLVTCGAILHYEDGTEKIFNPKGGHLDDFLFSNSALGNCSMFRKEDWKLVGGYDESMRSGWEDWEFYIRLMQLGGHCIVIPEPLFHYNKRKGTTTARANKLKYELWEYILTKHEALYKQHYKALVDFFLMQLEHEEQEKIKNTKRIDFMIGKTVLSPLRVIKKLWK
jgi:hypothetical protein